MSKLYDTAIIILPDGRRRTVQELIDVLSLDALTPADLDWADRMAGIELDRHGIVWPLKIEPGTRDYVFRTITHYVIEAMMGDQIERGNP